MVITDDVFFPGQRDEVLQQVADLVGRNPISVEKLLYIMKIMATATSFGVSPTDLLLNGLNSYPHLLDAVLIQLEITNG